MDELQTELARLDAGTLPSWGADRIAVHILWSPQRLLDALLERLRRPGPPSGELALVVQKVALRDAGQANALAEAIADAAARADRPHVVGYLAEALLRIREDDALVAGLLEAPSPMVRSCVAQQIGVRAQTVERLHLCFPLLSDPEPVVRRAAADALYGATGIARVALPALLPLRPEVADALLRLLSDPDRALREYAAENLGEFPEHAGRAWPRLLELLEAGPAPEALKAATRLGVAPDPERVLAMLGSRLGELNAQRVFQNQPGFARAALRGLADPDPAIRAGAASLLAGEVPAEERGVVLAALTPLLSDPEPLPRASAATTYGQLSAKGRPAERRAAAQQLVAMLGDPSTGSGVCHGLQPLARDASLEGMDLLVQALEGGLVQAGLALQVLAAARALSEDAVTTLLRIWAAKPELADEIRRLLVRKAKHRVPPTPDPRRSFWLLRLRAGPGGVRKDLVFVAPDRAGIERAMLEDARDATGTLLLHDEKVELSVYDGNDRVLHLNLRPRLSVRVPGLGELSPDGDWDVDAVAEHLDARSGRIEDAEVTIDWTGLETPTLQHPAISEGDTPVVSLGGRRRVGLGWTVFEARGGS